MPGSRPRSPDQAAVALRRPAPPGASTGWNERVAGGMSRRSAIARRQPLQAALHERPEHTCNRDSWARAPSAAPGPPPVSYFQNYQYCAPVKARPPAGPGRCGTRGRRARRAMRMVVYGLRVGQAHPRRANVAGRAQLPRPGLQEPVQPHRTRHRHRLRRRLEQLAAPAGGGGHRDDRAAARLRQPALPAAGEGARLAGEDRGRRQQNGRLEVSEMLRVLPDAERVRYRQPRAPGPGDPQQLHGPRRHLADAGRTSWRGKLGFLLSFYLRMRHSMSRYDRLLLHHRPRDACRSASRCWTTRSRSGSGARQGGEDAHQAWCCRSAWSATSKALDEQAARSTPRRRRCRRCCSSCATRATPCATRGRSRSSSTASSPRPRRPSAACATWKTCSRSTRTAWLGTGMDELDPSWRASRPPADATARQRAAPTPAAAAPQEGHPVAVTFRARRRPGRPGRASCSPPPPAWPWRSRASTTRTKLCATAAREPRRVLAARDLRAAHHRRPLGRRRALHRRGGAASSLGASWTQTVFQLDGLDVSDPLAGGRPLILPWHEPLDTLDVAIGGARRDPGAGLTAGRASPPSARRTRGGARSRSTRRFGGGGDASVPPAVARLDRWRRARRRPRAARRSARAAGHGPGAVLARFVRGRAEAEDAERLRAAARTVLEGQRAGPRARDAGRPGHERPLHRPLGLRRCGPPPRTTARFGERVPGALRGLGRVLDADGRRVCARADGD